MLQEVVLRRAEKDDLDGICTVYKQHMTLIFENHKDNEFRKNVMSEADFKKCLDVDLLDSKAIIIVGDYKGKIVGFLLGYVVRTIKNKQSVNVGYIEQGYVLPEFCYADLIAKGIELAKEWFKSQNVKKIYSTTNVNNDFSIKVLKKANFKEQTIKYICNI